MRQSYLIFIPNVTASELKKILARMSKEPDSSFNDDNCLSDDGWEFDTYDPDHKFMADILDTLEEEWESNRSIEEGESEEKERIEKDE